MGQRPARPASPLARTAGGLSLPPRPFLTRRPPFLPFASVPRSRPPSSPQDVASSPLAHPQSLFFSFPGSSRRGRDSSTRITCATFSDTTFTTHRRTRPPDTATLSLSLASPAPPISSRPTGGCALAFAGHNARSHSNRACSNPPALPHLLPPTTTTIVWPRRCCHSQHHNTRS